MTERHGYAEVRLSRPVVTQQEITRRLAGIDNANATIVSQATLIAKGSAVGVARPAVSQLTTSTTRRRAVTATALMIFTH